jgi:hypothetical protein
VAECQRRWRKGEGIAHPHVSLPDGWHLNIERVPVPPAPTTGPVFDAEVRRRVDNLPQALRHERLYRTDFFWRGFLQWEHQARRASAYRGDFEPGVSYDPLPDFSESDDDDQAEEQEDDEEEEQEDDKDFDPADEEEEEQESEKQTGKPLRTRKRRSRKTPDAAELVAANLIPPDYDEDVAYRHALEASMGDEDAKWKLEEGAEDFVRLSATVAAHHEELPPPPPLPPGFIPEIAPGWPQGLPPPVIDLDEDDDDE